MEDLIGLAVIFILVVVVGAICGLIALVQLKSLKQNVALLKEKVNELQADAAGQKQTQFANADTTHHQAMHHQSTTVTAKTYTPEPLHSSPVIELTLFNLK